MPANPKKASFLPLLVLMAVACAMGALFVYVIRNPPMAEDAKAFDVAHGLGFADAEIVQRYPGHVAAWQLGCGEDDDSAFDMRAHDASGKAHLFVVCCGVHGVHDDCNLRLR